MADTNIMNLLNVQVSTQPSAQPAGAGSSASAGTARTQQSSGLFDKALDQASAQADTDVQDAQDKAAVDLQKPVQNAKSNSGTADAKSREAAQDDAKDRTVPVGTQESAPDKDAEDADAAEETATPTLQTGALFFSMLHVQVPSTSVPLQDENPAETQIQLETEAIQPLQPAEHAQDAESMQMPEAVSAASEPQPASTLQVTVKQPAGNMQTASSLQPAEIAMPAASEPQRMAAVQPSSLAETAVQPVSDTRLKVQAAQSAAGSQTAAESSPEDISGSLSAAETMAGTESRPAAVNLQTILPQSEAAAEKGQDMLKILSGQGWQTTEARAAQGQPAAAGSLTAQPAQLAQPVQEAQPAQDAQNAQNASKNAVLSMLPKTDASGALQSLSGLTVLLTKDSAGGAAQAKTGALSKLLRLAQPAAQQSAIETVPADVESTASPVMNADAAVQESQTMAVSVPDEGTASPMPSMQAVELSKLTGSVEAVSDDAAQALQAQPRQDASAAADTVQDNSSADTETVLQQAVLSLKGTQSKDNPSTGQDPAGSQEMGKAEAVTQSHSSTPEAGVSAFQQAVQTSISGTQDASQAQQTTRTDYQIPQQIVDQARLIRRGEDTQMVIHLKPEHLGNLTLKVSVSADGSVNASFHSDNAQVRTIIENSLSQLRTELNNQGIKVDHVEVYAGLADGGLPQQSGQQGQQQGSGQHAMRSTQESTDAFADEQDLQAALAQQTDAVSSTSVDYRV